MTGVADARGAPCLPGTTVSRRAMILAAGKGTRMGALSETRPKPLTPVAGRTLIDRALDKMAAAGLGPVIVNLHHLAGRMEAHLRSRMDAGQVIVSDERDALLDTGGGVCKALPLIGQHPFFVILGDSLWEDGPVPALDRMAGVFRPDRMDGLLLLHPRDRAVGFDGAGDFSLSPDPDPLFAGQEVGTIAPRGTRATAAYAFAGVQILSPHLYDGAPAGPFSNWWAWNRALERGRLYGLVHEGDWMHVGTPEAIAAAEARLAVRAAGGRP